MDHLCDQALEAFDFVTHVFDWYDWLPVPLKVPVQKRLDLDHDYVLCIHMLLKIEW